MILIVALAAVFLIGGIAGGGWLCWVGFIFFGLCAIRSKYPVGSGGPEVTDEDALKLAQAGIDKAMEPYKRRAQEDFERQVAVSREEKKPIVERKIIVNTAPATDAEKKWLREG